ncbi:MarR family winged helix-turn-helix transcriptional regulator [Ferrimonas marina]|uniref:DNA-binding transcriptional regulator, MarR family n=1 Tax=Ferrimonas marina TaxID=299255 RepID=A0A1M5Z4T0_9GAMM|nr:MarR family transcriptional regulator [Ferrimonas marina]SHI19118.1 DNA-binding transcriptional regulator, MarR family [Ferrimonas marina]
MSDPSLLGSLFRLAHSLKRQTHQQIEQMDLAIAPMHVRVMKIIDGSAPCTANDVVQFLNRDKAQVTRLLKTLIEQDLLQREPNPNDKRSQLLTVTESGAALMQRMAVVDATTYQTMTKGLSADELDAFHRIADQMAQNLAER